MGYRDDFYVEDNIIGYTGDVQSNPTVYFKATCRDDHKKITFGHITQAHGEAGNVGREPVRNSATYAVFNRMVDGKMRLQECVYGPEQLTDIGLVGEKAFAGYYEFHTSRNRFEMKTGGSVKLLAESIKKHQKVKKNWEAYV
jgi:hypothetical protein